MDNAFGSVASRIIFGGLGDKFHGDLIPKGCYTIMLSSIFQGSAKLLYLNHNVDPPQVWIKDEEGSLVMWRKENMKLVWIFQYFELGLTYSGLWEFFGPLGCWVS